MIFTAQVATDYMDIINKAAYVAAALELAALRWLLTKLKESQTRGDDIQVKRDQDTARYLAEQATNIEHCKTCMKEQLKEQSTKLTELSMTMIRALEQDTDALKALRQDMGLNERLARLETMATVKAGRQKDGD